MSESGTTGARGAPSPEPVLEPHGAEVPPPPPPPLDLSHHLSRVTAKRTPSAVKRFYKYFQIPGNLNLAGGLPNAGYFPFDTLEAKVAPPNRFKTTAISEQLAAASLSDSTARHGSRLLVPHDSSEASLQRKIDLASALQYGTAEGYPALLSFVRTFARDHMHPNVPYKGGPEVVLTCGNSDGWQKCIEAFSNVWDEQRDWIRDREGLLVEEFSFMNAVQGVRPRGLAVVPVKIDEEGMLAYGPGGLQDVLANWDYSKGKRPHLMYTITMGQNPTSGLLSVQRRREIYSLCQKYDILILEDDPYWNLQYPSANELSIRYRGRPVSSNYFAPGHNYQTSCSLGASKSSGYAFLDSLVPSYLSLDTDGRVVRMDTFSKIIAPGCRLGWITAQPRFIERIIRVTEGSTQQPSGFVQAVVAELIMGPTAGDAGSNSSSPGWTADGFVRWLEGLRHAYEDRMQVMASVLEEGKFLISNRASNGGGHDDDDDDDDDDEFEVVSKTQMYDFAFPMAGMFLWLHARFETHGLFEQCGGAKLSRALWILMTTSQYKVLICPGDMFATSDEINRAKGWQYFRLCFAGIDEHLLRTSTRNLVAAFAAFWALESEEEIDKLIEENDGSAEEAADGTTRLLLGHY